MTPISMDVLPRWRCVCLVIQSCPALCDPKTVHGTAGRFFTLWATREVSPPGGASGKESGDSPTQETHICVFEPRVGKIPWSKKWQNTLVFLPGESHGQSSLAGYSQSMGPKESDTTLGLSMHARFCAINIFIIWPFQKVYQPLIWIVGFGIS